MSRKRNKWQSASMNDYSYIKYLMMIESLALNRFRWTGLPKTCDARYLETVLLTSGIATIARDKGMRDVWVSVQACASGELGIYGTPNKWRAICANGSQFDVDAKNGVLVYNSFSRENPWLAIQNYAYRLSVYDRIEDINLNHQRTPWALIAPQEKKMEIVNIYKQITGGEPAILGDERFGDLVDNIKAIQTGVPYIGDKLQLARRNCMNEMLQFLGIPHLAFEKGERMIEDEARANTAQTEILLMDALQARRQACDQLRDKFGIDANVYFNVDVESYNFNYVNNIEAKAKDTKVIDEGVEL